MKRNALGVFWGVVLLAIPLAASGATGEFQWERIGGDPFQEGLQTKSDVRSFLLSERAEFGAKRLGISEGCWEKVRQQSRSMNNIRDDDLRMGSRFDAMVFGSVGRVERNVVFADSGAGAPKRTAWSVTATCNPHEVTVTVPVGCGNVALRRKKVKVVEKRVVEKQVVERPVVEERVVERVVEKAAPQPVPQPQPLAPTGPEAGLLIGGAATSLSIAAYLRSRRRLRRTQLFTERDETFPER